MAEYKKSGYKISDIYQGGYSSLNPSDNSITTGSLGMTTDPRVANVLQEVSSKLSSGVKQIEISAVSPEIFDSMPNQQLKEVHRLSKLTGIDVSLHGPVIEASGVTQQGFDESEREASEKRITQTLLRAKELNPEGNVPVVFHSSQGLPASQLLPPSKGKEGYEKIIAINKESGKMAPLESEVKYYPGTEELKPKKLSPEKRLEILNDSEWDNSLNQVFFNQERAQEILGKNQAQIQHIMEEMNQMEESQGKIDPRVFTPKQIHAYNNMKAAENYLQDVHQQANALFSKAYEFGDEHQQEILKAYSEKFKEDLKKNPGSPFNLAQATQELINNMKSSQVVPEMWVPVEEFSIENSGKTFGNAVFESYKKLGDKTPLLVIENPPAGVALSTGEDIKNIVVKSREQFVEKAKESGISESQAKKEAEKFIGATWDVGHINMLRKQGYTEEDIVKETKTVAPYVKHIHLSDNFGFEHTELPMGMGNVPLKKMMEKLGKQGVEAKKIIEAAHWWQHFKTSPFQEVLEGVGSPVYSMKMAPYWNQSKEFQEGYSSGYGQMLPQMHYETFGSGFSQLPQELGGQMPGAKGDRMSGRPME